MASSPPRLTESVFDPPNEVFRFGDLPPELRVHIYRELLCTEVVHIGRNRLGNGALQRGSNFHLTVDRELLPAVLRVSRLVYKEALPLFYSMRDFSCSDPGTLKKFVTEIGPGIQHVEHLKIDDWMGGSGAEVAFQVLANKASRLRTIEINLVACTCTRGRLLGSMLKESLRHYLEDVSTEMRHHRLSKISLHLAPIDAANISHNWCTKPSQSGLEQNAKEVMAVLEDPDGMK